MKIYQISGYTTSEGVLNHWSANKREIKKELALWANNDSVDTDAIIKTHEIGRLTQKALIDFLNLWSST